MDRLIAFGWRTGVVVLIIVDYFLYSTGNPSLTYSVLGGWFIVPLVGAALVTIVYAFGAYKSQKDRGLWVLHLAIVVGVSVMLLSLSGQARQYAEQNVEADVHAFVKDPTTRGVEAADQARALMIEIKKRDYTMERETFIPTFRRMDYLFKSDTGKKYRLILVKEWNGVPEISFLPTEH